MPEPPALRRIVEPPQRPDQAEHDDLPHVLGVGVLQPAGGAVAQDQLAIPPVKLAPSRMVRGVADAAKQGGAGGFDVHVVPSGMTCFQIFRLPSKSRRGKPIESGGVWSAILATFRFATAFAFATDKRRRLTVPPRLPKKMARPERRSSWTA